ncbi:MAG: Fe2+-dependent dioxygenase [Gammaproteobacteria bacterium]|nr:Fe2+-dependent dioxygenase [Gammaproteobacteria bacterium]
MLVKIENALDANKLRNVLKVMEQAPFLDGRTSAGKHAQRIKNNLEMDQRSQQAQYLNELVVGSLLQIPAFQFSALPHKISQPFFARYQPGMQYGDHIDDPVMGQIGAQFRCDVATTVFLNNPEDYEGGELVVNTPFGTQKTRLKAGDAVTYPASSLHHVAEVTKGERIVCVFWTQSMVRDPARRELLYELNLARESLMSSQPDSNETALIDRSYGNLVRMWADV